MQTVEITTKCGKIKGVDEGAFTLFKGIKYANAKRWEYPMQITSWDGVYDATEWGDCSYQRRAFEPDEQCNAFYHREFRRGLTFTYSEDCQYLNIYAPKNASKLPVAIYIHGGTFTGGSGNEAHIDGTKFAENGIVYITFNYRLGPWGFCAHPDLTDKNGLCGNYGLFDQYTALKWIKENIEAFGGDPDNITVMGQSAGSMSVDIHLSSDQCKNYFKGAFMMSATALMRLFSRPYTPEQTREFWDKVVKNAGVNSIEDLRTADPKTLFYAWWDIFDNTRGAMRYAFPVFDGKYLKKENFGLSNIPDISYLIGMTSCDMIPLVLRLADTLWARTVKKQNKNKCYIYMFDRDLPGDKNRNWHCSDMLYVFGTLHTSWRPFEERDFEIEKEMFNSTCAFIKNHDPNCSSVPHWEDGARKIMEFGEKTTKLKRWKTAKLIRYAYRKGPM